MNKIEYKFKPEDIVWFIFREEIFKGKIWFYKYEEDHETDKDLYEHYPELGITYTVEILKGEGKGNMIVLHEASLFKTWSEADDTAERQKAWKKKTT